VAEIFLQVKLSDIQIIETASSLPAGEPYCAPEVSVIVEANIRILQNLLGVDSWAPVINEVMRERLRQTKSLVQMISPEDTLNAGKCEV